MKSSFWETQSEAWRTPESDSGQARMTKLCMRYSLSQLKSIPSLPGIYKFYSSKDELLYVGKAKNLNKRISSYYDHTPKEPKTSLMVSKIDYIEAIPVTSEFEALLLEAELIKKYQPKYNVIWKDDKHFIYIKITKEKFPKIYFARKTDLTGEYFGPFPSSTIVKEILSYIRTIFPYCTQKESSKRACFYNHLGLCNPCPAVVNKLGGNEYKLSYRRYLNNIRNIRNILRGRINSIKKLLITEMKTLSGQEKFEDASIYRDRLNQLDYLVNCYVPANSYIDNSKLLFETRNREGIELRNILKRYYPEIKKISHIECYDISNISGKLATGSMVTFRKGEPDTHLYRRFRIRSKNSPDDFGMLQEMMSRRLKHSEWKHPDIFIIDGGIPQLIALMKILQKLNIRIPIIGLAKAYEEIVVPVNNSYNKLMLPSNSSALNLVKRLRDEAHRFAHNYHTLLRLKHLLNENML